MPPDVNTTNSPYPFASPGAIKSILTGIRRNRGFPDPNKEKHTKGGESFTNQWVKKHKYALAPLASAR